MDVHPAVGVLPGHPASSTRAVERAVDLLAEVCDRGEISLADCARRVTPAPSTALRLLRTLESSGLVSRDDRGLFQAGPRLVQLGAAALSRQSLVASAQPALRRIVEACGESAYLCLPGPGNTAIYAGLVEGRHSVRHTGWLGRSIELSRSAIGAALSDQVGPAGFVVMRSVIEPDVTAVAAPVYRPGQRLPVAALSVVGPAYRVDDHQAAVIGRWVEAEAKGLSQQFEMNRGDAWGPDSRAATTAPSTATRRTGVNMAVSR